MMFSLNNLTKRYGAEQINLAIQPLYIQARLLCKMSKTELQESN